MKTLIIILIILFLFVSIFFIVTGSKIFTNIKKGQSSQQTEPSTNQSASSQETSSESTYQTTTIDSSSQTDLTYSPIDENIKEINIYLDGDKNSGIFLGKANYGLPSADAAAIYGNDFSNFGFELLFDTTGYNFEPGTIHSLYIYSFIPAYGEEYIRKEITIPGEPVVSNTIKITSDSNRLIWGSKKGIIKFLNVERKGK